MRKRLFSLALGLVFIFQFFLQAPILVSAADEVKITAPETGNRITGQYIVRYSVSNAINPKNIVISYLDENGAAADISVVPIVASTDTSSYQTLIQGIGNGANTISVTVETQTGETFTDQKTVTVNNNITNIIKSSTNTEPYVTDSNKFKNLLKKNNTAGALEKGKTPKDNAFVNEFVDTLFEEAQAENVRPDVVFAQIMLETGWLGYNYTVRESQNNFGGIGATGGPINGNLFQSMRDGIRANVQHLVAYASKDALKGTLTDPRFTYVNRGVAPAVEYLSYYENLSSSGWAMAPQYGYKILDIISRLNASSAEVFPSGSDTPVITEFAVNSITKGKWNPLDVKGIEGFDAGQEIRLAVATNSATEHRFLITNKTTGTLTETAWSINKAVFYIPTQAGVYEFKAEIRAKGAAAAAASQVKEITIGTIVETPPAATIPSTQPAATTTPVDPDREIVPVIGSVTLSSSPYVPGKEVSITIKDTSAATARVNEYQLEVEHEGVKSLLSSWSVSRDYKFTPKDAGDYLIRVLSRNRLIGGAAQQGVTVSFTVTDPNLPRDLIAAVSASDSTMYKGKPYQINVTPVSDPGINVLYRLVKKSASGDTELFGWSGNLVFPYVPDQTGPVTLQVQAKNQAGDGTILDSENLNLNILELSIYSPPGYVPANPYGVSISNVHIAGLKSTGRNLIFNALSPSGTGLLYRFYVINSTGVRTLVKDWSTAAQANWRAVYGNQKLVVEVKHPKSAGYWDARMEMDFSIKTYPTVFLDPGHGGSDPGYVVTTGGVTYRESDLALAMTNLVRTKLSSRGINVITSRDTNVSISLDDRVNKAIEKQADLFITFHYMKSSYSSSKGVKTYYSGFKSNPLANMYLAEGKEAASLIGPAMAYYYTLNRGFVSDTDSLGYSLRLLKNTTMPSIQLSMGYMSNYEDMIRIKSAWFRNIIAQKIADSIIVYLNNN